METIDAVIDGGTLRIIVKLPRLDASTVPGFKKDSSEVWNSKINGVSADLSQVDFLDSAGIGALLSLYRRLPTNSRFRLRRVRPPVQAIIELLRLHRIFDLD
jgi:anti-sigma B factor antagonist